MSIEKLITLNNESIDNADVNSTTDINNVRINMNDTKNDKISKFIDDIRNPYLYRVNDVIVKVNFNAGGKSFEDALIDFYKTAV